MNIIVEFYPQEKFPFPIFFEPFITGKIRKRKWLKLLLRCGPTIKMARSKSAPSPALLPRTRALPPRPQRGPRPAKRRSCAPRLGRDTARSISAVHAHPMAERASRANKTTVPAAGRNPSFISSLPFSLIAQRRSEKQPQQQPSSVAEGDE